MTTESLTTTNLLEEEEEQGLYTPDSDEAHNLPDEIDVREDPQTIYEWMRKYRNKRLIIDPDFQRLRVWNPYQRSRFIESVLMGIPLPPLYVNQTRDGSYMLIDGLQRTTTLYDYIEKKDFALDTELQSVVDASGKQFDELPALYQSRIEDRKLLVYVIKPSVDMRLVYVIFERINSGGTPLNRQELRNSFYNGPATRLLKELAASDEFQRAMDFGISPARMRDREAVLRCLAFQINGISNYKNDMDAYLRSAMEELNRMSEDQLNTIRIEFRRTMKNIYTVFGDKAFRIPTPGSRGRINVAIMESVYSFFKSLSDDQITRNSTRIMNRYRSHLMSSFYVESVTQSTGTTSRVVTRFKLAAEILGNGLC